MSATDSLEGAAFLAATFGAVALAAAVVVLRRMPELGGVPRVLAFSMVATFGLVAAHVVPGALGLLGRWSVLAAGLVILGAALATPAARPVPSTPDFLPSPPGSRLSWILAIVVLAGVVVYSVAFAIDQGTVAASQVDMLNFHLPNVARWIQSGTFWRVDEFVPDFALGNYPHSGDVLLAAVTLPWRNDWLVRYVNYPFLGLTGLSTYAIARELRAPAASAVVFAAGVVTIPAVMLWAELGLTDTLMLAGFGSGVYFLVRHSRTRRTSDLAVAAVALGLSFGTKWYAVPAVAAVVLVWGVGSVLASQRRAGLVRSAWLLGALVLGSGGFWLVRNWVELGNPFFPVKVAPFGVTIFDAPRDISREHFGVPLSHYLTRPGIWRDYLFSPFMKYLGLTAIVLWIALALAGGTAIRDRLRRRFSGESGKVLALVACAALIAAAYVITPYTATGTGGVPNTAWVNARYVVPALLLGAPAGAWLVGRMGRAGALLELAAAAGVAYAMERMLFQFFTPVRSIALAAVTVVLLLAAAWLLVRAFGRVRRGLRLKVAFAATAVLAAAALAVGEREQRRFNAQRYASIDPAVDWVKANAPAGHRIGVAGIGFAPVYTLFGPRLGNRVAYVGRDVRGILRPYSDRRQLGRALRAGGYDLVLVRHYLTSEPNLSYRPASFWSRQPAWVQAAGYEPVVVGRSLSLYRRSAPLAEKTRSTR
jgi:hypothetical protein